MPSVCYADNSVIRCRAAPDDRVNDRYANKADFYCCESGRVNLVEMNQSLFYRLTCELL